MKYIANTALREYVKEELRVSIFQMAHKLAVQTGCEVLVKLEDCADHSGCQYYATRTLNLQYMDKGLSRQPWEEMVSGVTGLPVTSHASQHDQPAMHNGCGAEAESEADDYDDPPEDRDDDDASLNDSAGSPYMNNGEEDDKAGMLDQMNEDGGEAVAHLVKSEPNTSMVEDGEDDEEEEEEEGAWNKPTGAFPFPVSIESALGSRAAAGEAETSQGMMDHDQIQQQIYIYANTNTEGGEHALNLSAEAEGEEPPEDPRNPGRRRSSPSLNYKCTLCQKTVSSVQLLMRHAKAVHPGNASMRYRCVPCEREYKHGRHLEQHTELHSRASYRCATCCKGFYRSSTLREHELREHQGRYRYYCPKCHKGFMRPSTMQTHLNRSHPAWFNKNKASQLFVTKTVETAAGVADSASRTVLPAKQEGGGLESFSGVRALMRVIPSTSGGLRPIVPSLLKNSEGTSEGILSQPRVATVNEELRHQAQKKMMKVVYQCKECGRLYENANSLVRHIHDRHDSRTKMRCSQCSYRTSRTSDLARHKRAKHSPGFAGAPPQARAEADMHGIVQDAKESEPDKDSQEPDDPDKDSDL